MVLFPNNEQITTLAFFKGCYIIPKLLIFNKKMKYRI